MRVLEGVEEPPERVRVLEAVLGHREVAAVPRLEQEVRDGDLHGVEDVPGPLAGEQERGDRVDVRRLVSLRQRGDQLVRLHGVSGSRLASRRASETSDGLGSSEDWFRCASSARWIQLT